MRANLDKVLRKYHLSFMQKVYSDENNDYDLLMDVFGITPQLKRENRQYWGERAWEVLGVAYCRGL
ncbi:hypothetical protein LU351_03315 [Marinibactrum halimedae]|uniref:Uncharacterized protein n=1 Tax=Marinibactrum halimedae TaxID=1444977 RepID=A0AA37TDD6_9GAMM|nr:hypothetical protein [Marinibactrum halimedae]GLS27655.1 hypothetical protein GCM10007877_33740 [Marinibactrum halimedae]